MLLLSITTVLKSRKGGGQGEVCGCAQVNIIVKDLSGTGLYGHGVISEFKTSPKVI